MRKLRRLSIEVLEGRVLLHGEPGPAILDPDANGDGRVDIFDLNLISTQWGVDGPVGDTNGDRHVDLLDLSVISAHSSDPLAHPNDPIKQAEHLELLALVNRGEATAVAVENGPWSDSETWLDGILPTNESKVWVPQGVSVTIDGAYSDRIAWIRVDGTLSFANDRDTRLTADTIVGSSTSRLEINTRSGFTTTLVFADRGPIDTDWDPFDFSRGMVWHGSASIHGAEKAPYTFAASELAAGQKQIALADTSGWRVGDKLIIASTSLDATINQDDVRHVVAIVGNLVTIDAPLTYSHMLVDGHPPVIENLTRNVTFTSENTQDSTRSGHVMFMHNPNVEIAYAAFAGLGRTDKTRGVTAPDGLGGGLDNPIGRYALHFHRTGFQTPVSVTGVAIDGSPGWGLVNHESYVNARYNVSYNVVGTHYVTESGDELGEFVGNVAVRSHGDTVRDDAFKLHDTVRDFGIGGDGFWMESPLVPVVGNIAVGMSGTGIFMFPETNFMDIRDTTHASFLDVAGNRVLLQPYISANFQHWSDVALASWQPNFPGAGHTLDEHYWDDWHQTFAVGHIPFHVADNLVYGSGLAMSVWGYTAADGQQAQIVNNTFFGKVFMGYSHSMHFLENRVLAPNPGADWAFTHTGVNGYITYEDNTITGWYVGIEMPTEDAIFPSHGPSKVIGGYFDNVYSNIVVYNTQYDRFRTLEIVNPTFGPTAQYNINMDIGFFNYNINALYPRVGADDIYDIETLFTTSSLGPAVNTVTYNGQRLYFGEQAADFKFGELLTHTPDYWTPAQKAHFDDLRHNAHGAFATTADLAAEGLIVGGVALPPGIQYYLPKIRGVFVRGKT